MLAAAGRELSAAELAALPLADRDAAEAAVLDTGLVCRVGGGLRFRHGLLAEAVRAGLGEQGRRYEQLALAIEAAAGSPEQVAAEVVGHLHRAGRDDLAGPRWQRAARPGRTSLTRSGSRPPVRSARQATLPGRCGRRAPRSRRPAA